MRAQQTTIKQRNQHTLRALPLLVALIMLLSACSDIGVQLDSLARIAATPYQATIAPSPTIAADTISTAALVKERSKLRVGIRFDAPPLSSVNSQGELQGLDVDLARELARRWLGSPDNVEFVQVTSSSAPQRIERREVDIAMGGLIHTKAAEPYADFGLTYMVDGEALLVRTGSYGDFPALAQRLVTYIDPASTFALRDAMISNNITVSLQSAQYYGTAVQQLLNGETDAVAGRWRRLRAIVGQDPALTILTVFNREPVAYMLPQNDSDWASLVNSTFSALVADGTFATLYEKWFNASPEAFAILPNAIDLQLAMLPDTMTRRNGIERLRNTTTVRFGFVAQADPLATLDANGQAVGFEIDITRALARRWFQDAAAAQFAAYSAADIPNALANGDIDMAVGALVQTQAQSRLMDFSLPTFQTGTGIAVLAGSLYADSAALSGRYVGIIRGHADAALLERVRQVRGINLQAIEFGDLAAALSGLRTGQVDAVLDDQVTLLALSRATTDILVLSERLSNAPIGIALPRNDSALRDFVNLTLQDMLADGTYARIYQRWFGVAPASVELWSGDVSISTALIAPTATTLPTPTPVFEVFDTPTPLPLPTIAPPEEATPVP